jgi:RHS repeat-associated protein
VTETVAVIENNIRFPGQYEDVETGLHYNYFRDYDPSLGRYVESDPIGLDGGLNTFAYAGSAPVRFSDPLGLFFAGPVCGSDGNSQFFPDSIFTAACGAHDDCYGCSGEKQGKSRSQCDSEFLEGMKGMCRFLPNPIACMGVAYSYYAGVRAFGGSDFTDGRKEDCGCE